MDCPGVDDKGNSWTSPAKFWEEVLAPAGDGTPSRWYRAAVGYWEQQEASNKGVLGGFDELSSVDIADSGAFIQKVLGDHMERTKKEGSTLVALDCGAGIGRVTGALLLHHFHEVDLVEPCEHLLNQARALLPHENSTGKGRRKRGHPADHRAVGFIQMGIQDFKPERKRYDLIWIQWALLYLTDEDLVAFLGRCRQALRPGGVIIAKENVADKQFVVDTDDLSITRTHAYYLSLFDRAKLTLVGTALQRNFPKGLYKVRMFALKPQ